MIIKIIASVSLIAPKSSLSAFLCCRDMFILEISKLTSCKLCFHLCPMARSNKESLKHGRSLIAKFAMTPVTYTWWPESVSHLDSLVKHHFSIYSGTGILESLDIYIEQEILSLLHTLLLLGFLPTSTCLQMEPARSEASKCLESHRLAAIAFLSCLN